MRAALVGTVETVTAGHHPSYDELDGHLRTQWPGARHHDRRFPAGPMRELIPNFLVRVVEPSRDNGGWVYASLGASTQQREGLPRTEFFLLADHHDDRYVEMVTMVAHYHLTIDHPLHVDRFIAIGQPLAGSGGQNTILVTLPYPYGPKLEWCKTHAGDVRYLWLLPIYESERDFIYSDGLEALEQRFDDVGFDVADLQRAPVA